MDCLSVSLRRRSFAVNGNHTASSKFRHSDTPFGSFCFRLTVDFRGLHCYVLIFFPAVTYFSSYQHVIKRLLYKWAVCDTYIVNSINLDKMALRDTHAAVMSDTRGILRKWVTYTADMVCENKRERERETDRQTDRQTERDELTYEWKKQVVHNLHSSPDINFLYENWPPFLKTQVSLPVEFIPHCF